MTYVVKEVFKTLQGEGFHAGRVAVFCRFAGCNLWNGREEDRTSAQCRFCDTDFVGGAKYESADALANAIEIEWGSACVRRMVVLTGGEPLLQYDHDLHSALKERGFYTAVETNGTVLPKALTDWVCLSPKAGTDLKLGYADEIKLVWPQALNPDEIAARYTLKTRSIQPMDGPERDANTQAAISFCLANPEWRLSLQTHKWIGIR